MQSILQTLFNLNNTSYWHPLIWIFGAGIVLYKMPQKTELLGGRLVQRWYGFTAILLVLPYILWAGCRTNFIDTSAYIYSFRKMPSTLSAIPGYLASNDKDQGFSVLSILCKSIGITQYQDFFLLIAVFQMLCIVSTFRKYSENFWISFFLFVASTDYLSWMHNGIRQFIAVSMIFAAFPLQVKGKYWRFALVVLLASTIHGSALLMLPFAYIMTGPVLNRKTFLMIGGVALLIPFIDNFLPMLENLLMDTQYNDVMTNGIWESDDGTNLIRVLVYSVPALVALLGRKYIRRNTNPVTNLCINASMITMAIYLISSVTSGIYIGRIPIYTTLHGYMVLPWLIDQIFEKLTARFVKLAMVLCYVAFYYYQMQNVWGLLNK